MSQTKITPGTWGTSPAGDHKDIDNKLVNIWSDEADNFFVAYDVDPRDAHAIAAVPKMIETLTGIAEASDCKVSRELARAALRQAGIEVE